MSARELRRRAGVWGLFALYLVPNVLGLALWWDDDAIRNNGLWDLVAWGGFPLVGAIILSSRRGNRIGWLFLLIGIGWTLSDALSLPIVLNAVPGWAEAMITSGQSMIWLALVLIVLLFPTGRVETRLGRAIVWLLLAVFVVAVFFQMVNAAPLSITGRPNPLAIESLAQISAWVAGPMFFTVPVLLGIALVDLGLRWRRASGAARAQYRWFVFGTSVTIAVLVLLNAFDATDGPLAVLGVIPINAIPVCVGIAITRHGLYEIGRVVSRTVSYIVVTAAAIGVYALIVVVASSFVPADSPLLVALATLAAAALFLPGLRWVQRWLDRSFDRERYDAERVVESFGERLRNEIDPEGTVPGLVTAVERALQPSAIGVWTRGAAREESRGL